MWPIWSSVGRYALGRAWASDGGGVEGEWRAKIVANLNGKILDGVFSLGGLC